VGHMTDRPFRAECSHSPFHPAEQMLGLGLRRRSTPRVDCQAERRRGKCQISSRFSKALIVGITALTQISSC
jgi:hypothetical protein